MISQFEKFVELHKSNSPVLLGNVWNVQSAKVFEELKFSAIGTSSAAIANMLGYEDGENITFDEYFYIIKRIAENTSLPLSVDIEAGFGNNVETIISNIKRLTELNVVGINIEDSIVENFKRTLLPRETFSEKLNEICKKLEREKVKIFINVRTDTYLSNINDKLKETLVRIHLYEKANINGIFVPCITSKEEIKELVNSTKLPINVMCMPDLPGFKDLSNLGVKRISMGNFVNDFVYKQMENKINEIIQNQNFEGLF